MHRIFLVDDHPLLREGVAHLIRRHAEYEICGEASSAGEALQAVPEESPDLVIVDMNLPDRSGLELIKDLQAVCPGIPVLVLSMHDELLYAERVIRAGAKGYIMKETASPQLMKAIKTVLNGGIVLSEKASAHILGGMAGNRNDKPRFRLEQLTDREVEVFELVGQGKSAHQIGDQLNISPRTVDAHRAHIREKLGLPDSPALMRYAVRWVETAGDDLT